MQASTLAYLRVAIKIRQSGGKKPALLDAQAQVTYIGPVPTGHIIFWE